MSGGCCDCDAGVVVGLCGGVDVVIIVVCDGSCDCGDAVVHGPGGAVVVVIVSVVVV